MDSNNNEKLKALIAELLGKMGFETEIHERAEEGRVVFNVRCKDAQLLIGKQGATLESLQHIVRLFARKALVDEKFSFGIDIDDYRDKRVIYLKELARKAAHQVRESGQSVSLSPMPAYERRIIHNYLSLYSDLSSESTGKDPNRRIVVKNKGSKASKADEPFTFIENS
ncbi:MAG: protein jag [Candidatus Saccharibacteria bacterium]